MNTIAATWMKWNHRLRLTRCYLASFQKYVIFPPILAYPFKPGSACLKTRCNIGNNTTDSPRSHPRVAPSPRTLAGLGLPVHVTLRVPSSPIPPSGQKPSPMPGLRVNGKGIFWRLCRRLGCYLPHYTEMPPTPTPFNHLARVPQTRLAQTGPFSLGNPGLDCGNGRLPPPAIGSCATQDSPPKGVT